MWKIGKREPWTVGRRMFYESLPEYAAAIVRGRALEVLRACGFYAAKRGCKATLHGKTLYENR
jgi:hypothetical protein